LVQRYGSDADLGLIKILVAERLHYIPMYSSQLKSLIEKDEFSGEQFTMIPIDELKGQHIFGAVGCTYSPWGLEVIEKVNKGLLKTRSKPVYFNALKSWAAPKGQEEQFHTLYIDEVLSRTTDFAPVGGMSIPD